MIDSEPSGLGILVTCEHASHRLPEEYGDLGLGRDGLRSHVAWDPGARPLARMLARGLSARHREGSYSRVLIDLNRSLHHPGLIPRRSFGVEVPGNRDLSREERAQRVRQYYEPYRQAVVSELTDLIHRRGHALHLSVHTFVPRLNGRVRRAEVGLLYDPSRRNESETAVELARPLRETGLHVRMNYPYRGTGDGLTTWCRRRWPGGSYSGLEIEVNQKVLAADRDISRLARILADAVRRCRPHAIRVNPHDG